MLALTEKQFQSQVIDLFTRLGWWHHHHFDARRSTPGLPDLLLVHPRHGIIFAELKRDSGKTTPEQDDCIHRLNTAAKAHGWPSIAVVWRPRDLERIADIAQRGLRRPD